MFDSLETFSETAIFEMQEKINVRNKTSNYREALTGNIEENDFHDIVYHPYSSLQIS